MDTDYKRLAIQRRRFSKDPALIHAYQPKLLDDGTLKDLDSLDWDL